MKPTDRRGALRAGAAAALAGALATACGTEPAPAPAAGHRPAPAPLAPAPRRFPGQPDEITHGPRDRPRVALTFHGQGDPALARRLLAQAEHAGARVTVLAVGGWLDTHPGMARRILDGGHDLGNHTQRHIDINAMTEAEALAEIEACAGRLRRLTGSVGTWFRPSRARNAAPAVLRAARRAGYPHVLSYDVDSLDFTSPGAAAVVRNVTGPVRAGSVVSLHFGYPDTAAALPLLLADLDRRGLSAVTTTELLS
ncbi:polysaccharide deacetylase [Streptomyces tanashiensis]|uniref:Polysaccharide deacetylase family protein n=1 Tax=Streptomyces tanashiensis TaxID=67367 RepID=A0ABY6QY26_9ACTN|nr:polysaccharide deacetylase family protein [Streptomyces tanashiensis]UZX21567.1 polysaccharide deacetylase family protein [Streptomyces tanashiensis]GGS64566.1 polysaccharide deacetylase [Streptomyces tanashiensis]GGY56922.1 polysaccharide deacetylase [Streptomyces tanashiensis]